MITELLKANIRVIQNGDCRKDMGMHTFEGQMDVGHAPGMLRTCVYLCVGVHLKMTNKKSIWIAAGVIIFNLLLGHFFAPTGMMLTPVALTLSTAVIVFGTNNLRPTILTSIILGLIILHDIGLKLFAGGMHDGPGQGWLHLMLFMGLVPAYILTVIGVFRNKQAQLTEQVLSLLIFPLIMAGHVYLFSDLGLGRYYWYDWN